MVISRMKRTFEVKWKFFFLVLHVLSFRLKNRLAKMKQTQPVRIWNKFRKILLLVMYYLTKFDDVMSNGFWVIPKLHCLIYAIQFMTSWIIPFSFVIFESTKHAKERKKLRKFEYLENTKSFLDKTKSIFHSFWRAIIWWKKKL